VQILYVYPVFRIRRTTMKVHVTPLLSKGILKQKWMCAMGNARGILYVNSKHDNLLRRTTRVAELKETDDGRGWPWLLFDVQLVWAKGSQFLLSGYERRIEGIDTAVNTLQIWFVSVPAPGDLPGVAQTEVAAAEPTDEQIEEALAEASV
jgi:hypothetical protein